MKKISILFATIFILSFDSFAQNEGKDYRTQAAFGLKAGMNSSNVYDEKGEDFQANPKLGLAAGIFVAI